jgi:two-component system sensor histidine kinase KdpD
MNGMVSNLLDMARLSAGHVMLAQGMAVARGSRRRRRATAESRARRAIAWSSICRPALPLIEFDAVLVERVFCNLLENAAKYSPPGSTIAITARIADGLAAVSVADEGRGFPGRAPRGAVRFVRAWRLRVERARGRA